MGQFRAFSLLAALAAAAAAGCSGSVTPPTHGTPAPELHSIQHVIVILQENRSFDNLFMGFPGADTTRSGKCKPLPNVCTDGQPIPLRPVRLESNGKLGGVDIDHSHHGFLVEYNKGDMDGFDDIRYGAAGTGPEATAYPYRYVVHSEIKPYWDFAREYTLADHMFFTATASSFIAHQQIIAGTTRLNATESLTDQPDGMPWGCDALAGTVTAIIKSNGKVDEYGGPFPCFTQYGTLADLLDAAGTSWKYYVDSWTGPQADFSGSVWNGFDAIKKVACPSKHQAGSVSVCTRGKDWPKVTMPNTRVLTDIQKQQLPQVSWVIPTLADSDHPASGCNHGPKWVTSVVNAVGKSAYWKNTAIFVLWDDWGGWYDNVAPPQINYTSLGFRVPLIMISPFVKKGYVSHTQYDFGSILKFIEQNFGLGSLGTSDATASSLADAFDFTQAVSSYKPEAPPQVKPVCPKGSAQQIIDDDYGSVPE